MNSLELSIKNVFCQLKKRVEETSGVHDDFKKLKKKTYKIKKMILRKKYK